MLFGRWLKSGSNGDRQKYVSQRRVVAGAVKLAGVGRSWNVVRRFWISVAEYSGDAEGMSRIETSDN